MLDTEEHPGRVDRHDAVPGFRAEQILLSATGNAGIVHQNIQLAEMPGGRSHDGNPILLIGDVKLFEACGGADTISNLPTFMLHHIRDHDLGAFAGEHPCRGRAHSRCCASYDGDLACKSHAGSSP